jgi:hypothetical protein
LSTTTIPAGVDVESPLVLSLIIKNFWPSRETSYGRPVPEVKYRASNAFVGVTGLNVGVL